MSYVVKISELDLVGEMRHFTLEVLEKALIEVKRQQPQDTLNTLQTHGITAAFSWEVAENPWYWINLYDDID